MKRQRFGIIALLLLLAIVLLGWNQVFELRFEEPRRAIVTWEMMALENPIQPTIQGWAYYNKPPFFNWVMMLFCWLFNSFDEWVIRLPATLSLLATGFLFYRVSKQYIGSLAALLIGLFTITSSEIFFHSSIYSGEIDLFFLLLTSGQLLSIFVFHQRKQYLLMFVLSYFLAACGVLTKGLPSIAFQGITILAWLIATKDWKRLFDWRHFIGIGLFLGILIGYFYAYSFLDDAGAFAANLFKEASQRTALESSIWESALSFGLFPFKLLQLLLPWSLLLIYLFRRDALKEIRENRFLFFSLIVIITNLPLYWLSPGVKSRYLFMFFPFLYAIIAHFFASYHQEEKNYFRYLDKAWPILIAIVGIGVFVFPFLKLTREVSYIWLRVIGISSLMGIILYNYLKLKDRPTQLLWVVSFVVVARLGFNLIFLPAQLEKSTSMIYRQLSNEILSITKNAPVHFGDDVLHFEKEIKLGPISVGNYHLKRPPFFHYQIPYYLSKSNGHVMQFDEVLQEKVFYILPKAKATKHQMEIFKEFYPSKKKPILWVLAKK